jgi:hypothetical protein
MGLGPSGPAFRRVRMSTRKLNQKRLVFNQAKFAAENKIYMWPERRNFKNLKP